MSELQGFLKNNNFIVLGGHKCGTSSLHSYLAQHPEINLPKSKGKDLLNKANFSIKEYTDSYDTPDYEKTYGEISSVYLYSDKSCRRIKQYFPDCKLIIILRNPIDRAFSHYSMDENSSDNSPNVAWQEIANAPLSFSKMEYLELGMYSKYIEQYLKFFSKEQILILLFDDLVKNKQYFFKSIFNFVGVDDTFLPDTSYIVRKGGTNTSPILIKTILNSPLTKAISKLIKPLTTQQQRYILQYKLRNLFTKKKETFTKDSKTNLLEFYQEEILRLESLTGKDLRANWLNKLN